MWSSWTARSLGSLDVREEVGGRRRAPREQGWSAGFTLVEVLIVSSMIGTLAAIALPAVQDLKDKANVARAIEEIRTLEVEIAGHEADEQLLPATLADIKRGGLLDPWGNTYQYLNFKLASGGKGRGIPGNARKDRFLVPINSTYDLYSMGKDGRSTPPLTAGVSRDDIIRANDGGFVGLAFKY